MLVGHSRAAARTLRPLLAPFSQLAQPHRSLPLSRPLSTSSRPFSTTGLIPATSADQETFRARTSGGFTESHGVATDISPAAFDAIPAPNARGGRDVDGWRALYTATVGANWCNLHGTMHGGCAAWLVDNLTGRAVETLATDSWWGPGVSVTLDMTYHSPAPVGMQLDILVTVDRMTGSIGYTRCEVFAQETGERVCSGNHVLMWRKPKKNK